MENTATAVAVAAALPATSPANFQARRRRLPEDRISMLPDEMIHEILARLQSPKHAWKATILSKRWAQLLRSYPILEFEDELYKPTESLERFAKSIVENFSRQQGNMISLEAVRVKVARCSNFYSKLHDRILELAARSSLGEIDIKFGSGPCYTPRTPGYRDDIYIPISYSIPRSFFIPSQPNNKQFLRLKVLKLSCCNFHKFQGLEETENLNNNNNNNPFSGLGSSLKELCLENIWFPYSGGCDWILNSMIAGASLLEKLTLADIDGVDMIQIRNHGNIRVMEVTDTDVKDFEITRAQSLQRLSLIRSRVKISLTPNLKELYIDGGWGWDAQDITKLTANIPSLEFLTLRELVKAERVHIVNGGNLRQVRTKNLGMCKVEFDVQGQCRVFRDDE